MPRAKTLGKTARRAVNSYLKHLRATPEGCTANKLKTIFNMSTSNHKDAMMYLKDFDLIRIKGGIRAKLSIYEAVP